MKKLILILFAIFFTCCEQEKENCKVITDKHIESVMVIENKKAFDKPFYFLVFNDRDTTMVGEYEFYTNRLGNTVCD